MKITLQDLANRSHAYALARTPMELLGACREVTGENSVTRYHINLAMSDYESGKLDYAGHSIIEAQRNTQAFRLHAALSLAFARVYEELAAAEAEAEEEKK